MKTHRNSVISPAAVIATGLSVFLVSSAMAENRTLKLSDAERVAIFDEAGTFTFKAPANVTGTAQILVVGGGGAGGGISGGGGGGGGLQNNGSAVGGDGGTGTVIIRYAVNLSQLAVDFAVDSQTGILPFETVFTATVDQPPPPPPPPRAVYDRTLEVPPFPPESRPPLPPAATATS